MIRCAIHLTSFAVRTGFWAASWLKQTEFDSCRKCILFCMRARFLPGFCICAFFCWLPLHARVTSSAQFVFFGFRARVRVSLLLNICLAALEHARLFSALTLVCLALEFFMAGVQLFMWKKREQNDSYFSTLVTKSEWFLFLYRREYSILIYNGSILWNYSTWPTNKINSFY
jgi:hypothetical protein